MMTGHEGTAQLNLLEPWLNWNYVWGVVLSHFILSVGWSRMKVVESVQKGDELCFVKGYVVLWFFHYVMKTSNNQAEII